MVGSLPQAHRPPRHCWQLTGEEAGHGRGSDTPGPSSLAHAPATLPPRPGNLACPANSRRPTQPPHPGGPGAASPASQRCGASPSQGPAVAWGPPLLQGSTHPRPLPSACGWSAAGTAQVHWVPREPRGIEGHDSSWAGEDSILPNLTPLCCDWAAPTKPLLLAVSSRHCLCAPNTAVCPGTDRVLTLRDSLLMLARSPDGVLAAPLLGCVSGPSTKTSRYDSPAELLCRHCPKLRSVPPVHRARGLCLRSEAAGPDGSKHRFSSQEPRLSVAPGEH